MPSRGGPPLPYKVVAGMTPCPGGWLVASAKLHAATFVPEEPQVYTKFPEVFDAHPPYEVIALNAPVGYPSEPDELRSCERDARALLGRRAITVRRTPTRDTMETGLPRLDEHLDAVSLVLLPRLCEVASEMLPYRQRTVYEAHPELSFHVINGDRPLLYSKHSDEGIEERRAILIKRIPGIQRVLDAELEGVPTPHLYDVSALLWTARRIQAKAATRIPENPEWDAEGLRMEYVY
jgi:predicted RNase H-like nuclease